MSELKPFELANIILCETLILGALVGLVVRRHLTSCWAFAIYLSVVLMTDTLMLNRSFDNLAFWLLKEIVLNALKFAIAFELITRAFDRFPGAQTTARRVMRLVLVLTLITIVWVAAGWQTDTEASQREVAARIAGEFHARVVTATTWLFVAITALILWYRLPIGSMQKAILIGFVPYLIFFYSVLELRSANRWPSEGWIAQLDTWAYVLLLAYWVRSAWQPFREIMPGRRSPVPAVQGTAG